MRDSRLGWILLLMMVWARESLQFSCNDARNCNCKLSTPYKYYLSCPEYPALPMFDIRVNLNYFAKMRCHNNVSWSDFDLNSTTHVEEVREFSLKECPLPDSNLLEITQKIGFQPINILSFESFKNLGSIFERRHLSGFSTLKKLQLNNNGLAELPADLLTDLPDLMALDLRENSVVLPVQFFNSVPKLQWLELGMNKLTRIEPLLFRNLEQLNFLNLGGNELTDLDAHTFSNLTALSVLDISRNELVTLPREIFKPLLSLSELDISGNNFSTMPHDLLSNSLKLTSLRLNNNRGTLRTLPSGFLSNLTELENLTLVNNKLEDMSEDILWGSPYLIHLNFSGNSLLTLPKTIFKDTRKLLTLDLSSNRLTNLPVGIFEVLNELEILNLQRNNFTTIPGPFFEGLDNLKEFNLEYNGIKSIDHSYTSLKKLQILRLSHNQLTLKDDQGGFFWDISNLREVYLAHNNIARLPLILNHVTTLQMLDMKHNQISKVWIYDLEFASQDLVVDLTHNEITRIYFDPAWGPFVTIHPYSANVRILIEENPIVCDCNLYDLLRHFETYSPVRKLFQMIPGNLICHGPEPMLQIPVSELKSQTLKCQTERKCPKKCECWFRPHDDIFIVNCSHRNFSTAPEIYRMSYESSSMELDLTGNFLTEVPFVNQWAYGNSIRLLLSHNQISSVSLDRLPPALEVLELHHNNLTKLNTTVLEHLGNSTSLKKLTLDGNPWECSYVARNFLNFVLTMCEVIPKLSNITCISDYQPGSKNLQIISWFEAFSRRCQT